jgi:hypothetical protein
MKTFDAFRESAAAAITVAALCWMVIALMTRGADAVHIAAFLLR